MCASACMQTNKEEVMKPCAVCGKPFHYVMVPACQECCRKESTC